MNLDWEQVVQAARQGEVESGGLRALAAAQASTRRASSAICSCTTSRPRSRRSNVGWPIKVVATGGHYIDKAMENPDQININVEFENDHTMVIAGSTCNELGVERVIRGHKANLFVGGRNAVIRPEAIWAERGRGARDSAATGPAAGSAGGVAASLDRLHSHAASSRAATLNSGRW